MPVSDLMNPATGIYANPGARGYGWEKLASIELLNDPNGGFGSTCGVRIRGGSVGNPAIRNIPSTFFSAPNGELRN